MAFEELKENLSGTEHDVRSYIEHNKEYYKLLVFKILMQVITSFTKMLFISAIILFVLFLLSLTASIAIGQAMDNMLYGFLIVSVFFVILGVILYLLRNKLDKPLIKMFSKYYFDKI
jgi:ABC-type multidrug transport system fused ATPase/permease subunit